MLGLVIASGDFQFCYFRKMNMYLKYLSVVIVWPKMNGDVPKNHQQVLEFAALGSVDKNGVLVMPTLYSMDKKGKYREWTIYIGALVAPDNSTDVDSLDKIPITQEYIDRAPLPEDGVGAFWTMYGEEGGAFQTSAKTLVYVGKNCESEIPKKNYTTPLTQAILEARSKYNLQLKKGYTFDKLSLKKAGDAYTFEELFHDKSRGEFPWRIFAMAVHDYNKFRKHINYPAMVQYKLDGNLFIVVSHPLLPNIEVIVDDEGNTTKMHIDGYSRKRETYEGQDHIYKELYPIIQSYPGLHFVGELWKEGYGLQDISGSSRRKTDSKARSERILNDFNIFDCFYLDSPDDSFENRQGILDDVFMGFDLSKNDKYITRIPTYLVDTEKDMLKKYREFIKVGYEGAVIRNTDAPYEYGINKEIRTYKSLKLKPRPDGEWPIVDFTDGKGKEVGAITWICAENDTGVKARTGGLLPLEERKTFSVTPNQPTDLRKHIFSKLSNDPDLFKEKIYGKDAVISYSILSTLGLAQQPKMLRFRDSAIDEMLKE
jgi:hypothetical protein